MSHYKSLHLGKRREKNLVGHIRNQKQEYSFKSNHINNIKFDGLNHPFKRQILRD